MFSISAQASQAEVQINLHSLRSLSGNNLVGMAEDCRPTVGSKCKCRVCVVKFLMLEQIPAGL